MSLHLPDLVIILIIGLLIFGPKKLPEKVSSLFRTFKEITNGEDIPVPSEVITPLPKEENDDLKYLSEMKILAIEREIVLKKSELLVTETSQKTSIVPKDLK